MVINEFECELFRNGYNQFSTQPDTSEDEAEPLKRAHSWEVLFPEVVQDFNTLGNNHSNNQHNVIHPKNSVDAAIDDEAESQNPSYSISSDSSVEDAIILKRNSKTSSYAEEENNISRKGIVKASTGNIKHKSPSPMHKPPAQVMERDDHQEKYDPKRIPSSVFSRNDSLTPAEWSAASTESLFSLHVGNTSIGREQALLLSAELKKLTGSSKPDEMLPEELTEELRKLAGLSKAEEPNIGLSSPTSPKETSGEDQEVHEIEDSEEKIVSSKEEEISNIAQMKIDEHNRPKHILPSIRSSKSSLSHHSDESETSTRSFAFPILGEGEEVPAKHLEPHNEAQRALKSTASAAFKGDGFCSCFKCFSCFSCFSCKSCSSYFSHIFSSSSKSCFSCKSCVSCSSCFSCTSFSSCRSCSSCFSCNSFCPKCC